MKHLTFEESQLVIQWHLKGFTNRFIAKQFNRGVVTIYRIIKNWKCGKFAGSKKRRLRKTKLTAQQTFNVLNYFVQNPFHYHKQCIKNLNLLVCETTIRNVLSKNGVGTYAAYSKQFLTLQNQIKRLKFALKYRHWSDEWLQVNFLDEKTVQTYANGRVAVKRKKNERQNVDKMVTTESQNGRNKVNLMGIVSFNGPNKIYSVSTNFTGEQFEQLIRTKVEKIVRGTILMDNAKIHLKGMDRLRKADIKVLDFPPKSPDLNVIENIWAMLQRILNRKLRNLNVSTKDELLKLIEESWKEIPVAYIRKCILSMPKRLEEVIKMKGRQTKY